MRDRLVGDRRAYRSLNVGLADGFALAIAHARSATLAACDQPVRRSLPKVGLQLAPSMG